MSISEVNSHTLNISFTQDQSFKNTKHTNGSTTIFCNPIGSNIQQRIDIKRKEAREQAKHLIMTQYENHEKFNESIEEIKKDIEKNNADLNTFNDQVKWLREQKEALKEDYGITPDSQEQKDLLLIEKANQGLPLDEEENKRFMALDGVTAYQAQCLEIDEGIKSYTHMIDSTNSLMAQQRSAISELSIARLKDNGMFKATEGAKSIMDNANDEVIAMAVQDSLHILEEKQEAAEESAKKIAEQVDETSDEDTTTSDKTNDLIEKFNQKLQELQKKLKELQQSNHLLADDMKGLVVDQTV